ncbi:FAD-binding and (Fe-S)-binding domain-containing protein [Propionibacterium sp.]|uniref:FAD-binding and (Fe-S)-binding domain-containing protein n=1 Tax=Propionibacterium sp. TaxID=1977903 RepID=UPI0039E77E46
MSTIAPASSTTTADKLRDLRAELGVDNCLDDSTLTRALYSTDASVYRVVPQAVAMPHDRDELIAVIRAALKVGLPVTGRGAGTSCAGNAVGAGLVVDMRRHFHDIISVDPESATAVVQPGVVQSWLQRAAAPYGLRFGPDPSTSNRCTIGGMVANNACGPRALGYGRSADNTVSLEVVTGTGELLRLGGAAEGERPEVLNSLDQLVDANLAAIRTECGRFTRQVSGYSLEHMLPENGRNAAKFFGGSEGTLGIITEATVKLVADAPCKTTVALGYPTMPDAGAATMSILEFHPTAIEGMDRRLADIVADRLGKHAVPPLPRGDGWAFVELVGSDTAEIAARAHALVEASGALEGWVVDDPAQAQRLWGIRSDAAGLAGVALDNPAYAGWEDSAVPPENLGQYLRDLDGLLAEHGLHGLPYGHFGDGCVHCRIDFPFDQPGGVQRYHDFMLAAGRLVASHGGSMSGEHGDGRARGELLPLMYSPGVIDLFGAVKRLFDPENLLNPGVIVDPAPTADDIRVAATLDSPLRASDPQFTRDVHQCSGVGKCLADTTEAGGVMCPSYQATGDEKDSTRGRSRALQEMINGELVKGWRSPELAEALEFCLACKGCRRDCPTGIDMAAYKSRVLYHRFRHRLRPMSHYAMGKLPTWGRLVTTLRVGRLGNLFTQTPGLKNIVKGMAGVDQRRPMPRFRPGVSARQEAARTLEKGPAKGRPVAVWVDSFSDAFEGGQILGLVATLVSAGFSPQVIEQDACCGLTWITTGQLDGARAHLRHAVEIMAPIAEAGTPIVGMEPSCMAVWRSDAAELLPDEPRVPVIAESIHTLAELLEELPDWTPPDLSGKTIVAQPHCHHASVLGWAADQKLLERTGAKVITLGGCCGLAGNFGVERGHYEVSVKVAEHDLLPAIDAAGPDAILLADGFSCRKQIADLRRRKAMSLGELLASHL